MPKFKLLAGQHAEKVPGSKKHRIYRPGDVIESDVDLDKFNTYSRDGTPFSYKFERVQEYMAPQGDVGKAAPTPTSHQAERSAREVAKGVNLEAMTPKELTAFAAENQIDLKGAKAKEDIVRIIRMMT